MKNSREAHPDARLGTVADIEQSLLARYGTTTPGVLKTMSYHHDRSMSSHGRDECEDGAGDTTHEIAGGHGSSVAGFELVPGVNCAPESVVRPKTRLSMDAIVAGVCAARGVSPETLRGSMRGKRKGGPQSAARTEAARAMRAAGYSWPQVAGYFAVCHTTIMAAVHRADAATRETRA